MKQDKAMELVAALRSGKYEQATGNLNVSGVGYCCLGIACDISGAGEWKPYHLSDGTRANYLAYVTERDVEQTTTLPSKVRDYFGFRDFEGSLPEDLQRETGYRTLWKMNDNGANFREIADFIEKHW